MKDQTTGTKKGSPPKVHVAPKRPRTKQIVKVDKITYGIGLREKGE